MLVLLAACRAAHRSVHGILRHSRASDAERIIAKITAVVTRRVAAILGWSAWSRRMVAVSGACAQGSQTRLRAFDAGSHGGAESGDCDEDRGTECPECLLDWQSGDVSGDQHCVVLEPTGATV